MFLLCSWDVIISTHCLRNEPQTFIKHVEPLLEQAIKKDYYMHLECRDHVSALNKFCPSITTVHGILRDSVSPGLSGTAKYCYSIVHYIF